MTAEKTPGQVSWTARNMALAGPAENPADTLARLDAAWDYLTPGQQEAEEAGAQAVLDNRTPWGDADITVIAAHPRFAVVQAGGPDGEVVKVIAWGGAGLSYYDSLEEWKRANGDADQVPAEQEREAAQHARDMAAEDGDYDRCEPSL